MGNNNWVYLFELRGDVMAENGSRWIYISSSSERGLVLDSGLVGSLIMLSISASSSPSVLFLNSITSSSNASQNVLPPS